MGKNYHGVQYNPTPTIVEECGMDIADVRNRIMKYDANGKFVLATAGTDMPIGVATIEEGWNDITGETSGKVTAGEDVSVYIKDMCVVMAGAEIKKGQEIAAGADGLAAVAVSGNYVLGIATNDAQANGYVKVLINKYQKA